MLYIGYLIILDGQSITKIISEITIFEPPRSRIHCVHAGLLHEDPGTVPGCSWMETYGHPRRQATSAYVGVLASLRTLFRAGFCFF